MHAREATEISNQAITKLTTDLMKFTQEQIIETARNGGKKIQIMTSGPDMANTLAVHFHSLGYKVVPSEYSLSIYWE